MKLYLLSLLTIILINKYKMTEIECYLKKIEKVVVEEWG